ncbi:MAG TPA: hypothetical protein VG672_09285 [Bryobacteraceae bacterium]|jgi:hypothetical protein|nr:hypothetical protein [Bryobacteraceae bacterium]
MKAEEFQQRNLELAGWPVKLSTYRMGATFYCTADNVSPGAVLARATGSTRQEAEQKAVEHAEALLTRTRRHAV